MALHAVESTFLCSFLGFKSFILVTHYVAEWVTSLQYIKAYIFNKKRIESGNWTFGLLRERIGLLLPQSKIKCYMSACTWPNAKVKFPRCSDANCKLLLGVLGPQMNEQNGLKSGCPLCRLIEICKLTRVQRMALNISPFTPRKTDKPKLWVNLMC